MIGATTLHGLLMQASSTPASLGYGYLYNWYSISNTNFAPTDWKVPEEWDFIVLDYYTGNSYTLRITGTDYWDNDAGTDLYGFSAIGAGFRGFSGGGEFDSLNMTNVIGTAEEASSTRMYSFYINYMQADATTVNGTYKTAGVSVRLLYTGTGAPTSVTDYDGNIYDVVKIEDQYWTVQNWKCTKLNNGTAIPNVTDNTTWAGLTTGARCAYDNDENNV